MFIFSKHALKRINERGIKKEQILLFMNYVDNENNVGNGDISYTLKRNTKKELQLNGISGDLVSKFSKLAVIVCSNNIIKTCLYMNGKKGKRYINRGNHKFKKLKVENENISLFKEINNG